MHAGAEKRSRHRMLAAEHARHIRDRSRNQGQGGARPRLKEGANHEQRSCRFNYLIRVALCCHRRRRLGNNAGWPFRFPA